MLSLAHGEQIILSVFDEHESIGKNCFSFQKTISLLMQEHRHQQLKRSSGGQISAQCAHFKSVLIPRRARHFCFEAL
jgi:hypothetical protein